MRRTTIACLVLLAAQAASFANAQATEARFCGSTCTPTDFWRNRDAARAAYLAVDCERANAPDIRAAAVPLTEDGDDALAFRFACAESGTYAFVVVADPESAPNVVASFVGWSFWGAQGPDDSGRAQFWLQLGTNTSELSLVAWTGEAYTVAGEYDLRDASDIEYVGPGRRARPVHIGPQGYCSSFPPPSDVRCDAWDHTAQPGYGGW